MKKSIIYRLNPFNNCIDMSAAEYVIKKLLAFALIFILSGVLGEAVIIGRLFCLGYDPLNGIMPYGEISELLFYYGFIIYSLITFAYCRFIEKRSIKTLGFSSKAADYLLGALLAVVMLFIIISICCISGSMTFLGFNSRINIRSLLLWLLAFVIQGGAEEIMCRGFLLTSLQKKLSEPAAIIISSTVFMILHLPSLLAIKPVYAIVGIINLYLVSAVFSVLALRRCNIWIACGLHSLWNYILYIVLGLSISGVGRKTNGVILFSLPEKNILNGAEYGIEASIITAAVTGIVLLVITIKSKGRIEKSGV